MSIVSNRYTINDYALSCDIFGASPRFYIGGERTYKTYFGSVISILCFLLMLSCGIYFCLQFFNTKTPNVVFFTNNPPKPASQLISKERFSFAFGLQNSANYEQFIDEQIYYPEVYFKYAQRTVVGTETYFNWTVLMPEVERCRIDHFNSGYEDYVKVLPLNNLYCLKNFEFILNGTYLNDEYSFLMVRILECKNSTTRTCKPKEEIDNLLGGVFMAFTYTDIQINPSNFTHPNQFLLGDGYTSISNKYFKEMHAFLKQVLVQSDNGILFENIGHMDFLQLDYLKEMMDYRIMPSFLDLTIKLSNRIDIYTRSYNKVQTIAAQVGGIIKLIMIVGEICVYSFTQIRLMENMILTLYDVNSEQKGGKNNQERTNILNNLQNNNFVSKNYMNNQADIPARKAFQTTKNNAASIN